MRIEKKRKLDASKSLELRKKNSEAQIMDPEQDKQLKEELLSQLNFLRDNILQGIVGGIAIETKKSGAVFEKHLEKNSDLLKDLVEGVKEGMDQEIKDLIESNRDAVKEAIENFTLEVTSRLKEKEEKEQKKQDEVEDINKSLLETLDKNTSTSEDITNSLEKTTINVEALKDIIEKSSEDSKTSSETILNNAEETKKESFEESKKSEAFSEESERLTKQIIEILEKSKDKDIDSEKLLRAIKESSEKILKTTVETAEKPEEKPAKTKTSAKDEEYEEETSTDEKVRKALAGRNGGEVEPELTGKQKTARFLKRVVFGEDIAGQMESRENKKIQYVQAQKQLRPEMSEKDLQKEYKNIEQQREELAQADARYQQLKESGTLSAEELEKTDIAKERKFYADILDPESQGKLSKPTREKKLTEKSKREVIDDVFKGTAEEKVVEEERGRGEALKEEIKQGEELKTIAQESKKHTEILTGIKQLLEKGGVGGGGGGAAAEGEGGGFIDTVLDLAGKAKGAVKSSGSTVMSGLTRVATSPGAMKALKIGGSALAIGAGAYTAYKGYSAASEEGDTKLEEVKRAERQGAMDPQEASRQKEEIKAETTEKKSAAVGKGTGMAAGAIGGAKVGAMIGTAFGGPVGTLIGGALGGAVGMAAGTSLGEGAGKLVGKGISGVKKMLGLYKDEKPTVEDAPQEASKEQTALKESTEIKFSEETFAKNDSKNYKKFVEFRDSRMEELTKKYEEEAKTANQKAYAPEKARVVAQAEAIKKFRKEIEASGAGEVVKEAGKKPLEKTGSSEFTPEKQAKEKASEAAEAGPKEEKKSLLSSMLPESNFSKAAVLATGPIGLGVYGAYKAGSWLKNKLFGSKEEGATVTSSKQSASVSEKTEEKPVKSEKTAAWLNAIKSEKEIIKDAGYNPEWKKAYVEALDTVTPRSDNPQSIQGAIRKAQTIANTKADQYGAGLKEAKSTASSETLTKQPDGTFAPKTTGETTKPQTTLDKAEQVRTEASKLGLDPNKATGVFKGGVLTGVEDESGKKYDVQVREEDRKKVEAANMMKQMNERSALLEQQTIKDAKTETPVSSSIAKATVDQTSVAAAKAAAKSINIQAPPPVVIAQPAQQQQYIPEPFTNNIRNGENSISRYIGSRYLAY